MLPRRSLRFWLTAAAILLIAGGLRLYRVSYGYNEICLTPPDEYWLFDKQQVSSLYTPNVHVPEDVLPENQLVTYPRPHTAMNSDESVLWLRFSGVLMGLLTAVLMLGFGLLIRADSWALAGLFVAVTPWFVNADRWLVRFDPAPLAVAISITALAASYRRPSRVVIWIQAASALSLFLLAPPLWWLALILVWLQPHPKWRILLFMTLAGLVTIPALQSPYHWLNAAVGWDSGATAACIWAGIALLLWYFRHLSYPTRTVLAVVAATCAVVSFTSARSLPTPAEREWSLIRWLQTRLPDGSRVNFDAATWPLAFVVACPMGAHIEFTPQPMNPRSILSPDFIVTTRRDDFLKSSFIHDLGDGYFVGRQLQFPQSVDVPFGDLLSVISYQIVTPQVKPGGLIQVRMDYQLSPTVTADALRYSAFIHVTLPNQPGDKITEFNLPFVQEMPTFGPRRLVTNQNYRFSLPPNTQPGAYELLFGIYDVYSGQRLRWSGGDALSIGQIEVQP
jgi:hypothetical protein